MARSGPPAYAWDWFARQRLPWRECRSRLAGGQTPAAPRYAGLESKSDVMPALRSDYPRDEVVRRVVDQVVAEVVFLGRTDVPFARLGARNAPRGMRWWWTAVTGEELDRPAPPRQDERGPSAPPRPPAQLTLDDVHEGYGD